MGQKELKAYQVKQLVVCSTSRQMSLNSFVESALLKAVTG